MTQRIAGVLAPVVTPFAADYAPDPERFARHCRWLLGNGVGLAVFGTNSEANSLAVPERIELLEQLVAGLRVHAEKPEGGVGAHGDEDAAVGHAAQ